jgi:hypothetical protein
MDGVETLSDAPLRPAEAAERLRIEQLTNSPIEQLDCVNWPIDQLNCSIGNRSIAQCTTC